MSLHRQHSNAVPRIAPLDPPYEPSIADALKKLMGKIDREPLKLFRTAAHSLALLRQLVDSGPLIYGKSGLPPLHRELIIQRTTARCGAEYEWGVHAVFFGDRVGLTGERLDATVIGDCRSACWSPEEALLIEFVDQLHERAAITDELWRRMSRHWSEAQMLELSMLAGLYHAISFVINVAAIEREDYAAVFPTKRE
ncbi:MAG: carboxymuconolactone decarboxylase family protein [Sulfurifustis sp.]